MIVLVTDFGMADPYVGQMKARIAQAAPSLQIIDLLHEVPVFNAHAGAHLIAALYPIFPVGTVFLCVVDPGVGTEREAVVVKADDRWFVGPDNGLLSIVASRSRETNIWRIRWRPKMLSTSFHGRDLFAAIAAEIGAGEFPHDKLEEMPRLHVEFDEGDLQRIIYIDHYGNAWSGQRAALLPAGSRVVVKGNEFIHADTFGAAAKGEGFWFANSVGLLELAVNRGNAAEILGLKIGDAIQVSKPN